MCPCRLLLRASDIFYKDIKGDRTHCVSMCGVRAQCVLHMLGLSLSLLCVPISDSHNCHLLANWSVTCLPSTDLTLLSSSILIRLVAPYVRVVYDSCVLMCLREGILFRYKIHRCWRGAGGEEGGGGSIFGLVPSHACLWPSLFLPGAA